MMESRYVYIKSDYDWVDDTLKWPDDFKDNSDYIEYCKRIALDLLKAMERDKHNIEVDRINLDKINAKLTNKK